MEKMITLANVGYISMSYLTCPRRNATQPQHRAVGVLKRWTTIPLHLVGDDVARDEGEGFADADDWRRDHVAFWNKVIDLVRADAGDPSWQLGETGQRSFPTVRTSGRGLHFLDRSGQGTEIITRPNDGCAI